MDTTLYSTGDVTTVPYPTMFTDSVDSSEVYNDPKSPLSGVNTSDEFVDGNFTKFFELQTNSSLFEAFAVTEIVMTALELVLAIVAALKIPRWTKNYRNQMLMQLSLVRFLKRIVNFVDFLEEEQADATSNEVTSNSNSKLAVALFGAQTYFDFVTVILIVFFIKHMYDSLIVVIVRINQGSFFKMLLCAWLLPLPISAVFIGIECSKILDPWWTYLLICLILRWPLISVGTTLYISILYRVFSDKIRRFARSLTITTFLLCLVVNFYLVSKDVIQLWCYRVFTTVLLNNISGFLLNLLVLCIYLILIIQNYKNKFQTTNVIYTENSIAYEEKT